MMNEVIIIIATVIVALVVIAYIVKKRRDKRISEQLENLPTRAQVLDINTIDIKEIRRYQASWGDWYVQAVVDGRLLELRFLKEPDEAQVYEAATQLVETEKSALVILEAEDGEIV